MVTQFFLKRLLISIISPIYSLLYPNLSLYLYQENIKALTRLVQATGSLSVFFLLSYL